MAQGRTYTGNNAANHYRGRDGNDAIYGRGGDDDLGGGAGDDLVDGGDGNDLVEGGAGSDRLFGGAGIDAVVYAGATGEVHVDLKQGYAREFTGATYTTDTLSGFEVVIGSRFDDSMIGSTGDDDLRGGAGNDYLQGGEGSDTLRGDEGSDILNGGAGFDYVDYFYTDGVVVDLSAYRGTAVGYGTDELIGIEGVHGSRSNDTITGDANANHLLGWEGDDVLSGGAGDDDLAGWDGRDVLIGGAGMDTLYGGKGADQFRFYQNDLGTTLATADRIMDFSQAERDRIDVRGIDANVTTRGNDAFTFIGNAAFTGVAGELRFAVRDGYTVVEGDVNGDKVADGVLLLAGQHVLTAGDFLL